MICSRSVFCGRYALLSVPRCVPRAGGRLQTIMFKHMSKLTTCLTVLLAVYGCGAVGDSTVPHDQNPADPIEFTITSPAPGETWLVGSEKTISWTYTGPVDTVDLAYTIDDGATWTAIASEVVNQGSYTWTVPDHVTDGLNIGIKDHISGDTYTASNLVAISYELTLDSPNGGASLPVGSVQTITWSSTATSGGTVDLAYSTDNGTSWTTIVSDIVNGGSYDWTVPNTVSSSCLVRVKDSDHAAPSTTNDSVFAISYDLILEFPTGGETLFAGAVETITWISTASSGGTVDIDYSLDNGATWLTIASDTVNDGSHDWTVPDVVGATLLVRVQDHDQATPSVATSTACDISYGLTITGPNGGETQLVASTQTITWSSTASSGGTVDLAYSTDNGTTWTTIVSDTANDGSYDWTIPDEVSTTCLVRAQDNDQATPVDASDAVFGISYELTLTAPNGGESLIASSTETITWTSTATSGGTVDLAYSADNGATWTAIASDIVNTGSYDWTVAGAISNQVLVRVSDHAGQSASDTSDAVCSIEGLLTFTSPTDRGGLRTDGTPTLTWTTAGSIPNVDLDWSEDGGVTWHSIASNLTNVGSYEWAVDAPKTTTIEIRLQDHVDGVPADQITVNTHGGVLWFVDGGVTSSGDGQSWARAFKTIQEAVGPSGAAGHGDSVWVAQGTYTNAVGGTGPVLQMQAGIALYGGFASGDGWSDRDIDGKTTTLDGQGTAYHVVTSAQDGRLDGFSVIGGNAAAAAPLPRGGGLFNDPGADITIAHCRFEGNVASGNGGAIYSANGTVVVDDCSIIGNASGGGAIMSYAGWLEINASRFIGNLGGGALHAYGPLNLRSSLFNGNQADTLGGGVYASDFATIDNCTFYGNSATISGGAISCHGYCTLRNSVLWNDTAGADPEISTDRGMRSFTNIIDYVTWDAAMGIDGGGNSNSDPLFVDADGADDIAGNEDDDLSLQAGSPARDAGDTSIIDEDMLVDAAGNGRVSNGFVDLGALEATGGAFKISLPNGGESWQVGDAQTIRWDLAGSIDHVDIAYTTDSGATWTTIATHVTNTGFYNWKVPDEIGSQFRIRVSDTTDALTFDISDGDAAIEGRITIIAPADGSYLATGQAQTVSWTSTGSLGPVDLLYSTNGGASWTPIATGEVNDGNYSWTTPAGEINDCLLRIQQTADGSSVALATFSLFAEAIHYVDANVGASGDGTSWDTAFKTIQEAIGPAGAADQGDRVYVAQGIYDNGGGTGAVLEMQTNTAVYGGFANGDGWADRDPATKITMLDGTFTALHVVIGADTSTLDGFVITGGVADGTAGGGMYNDGCSPTVIDCVFTMNDTYDSGVASEKGLGGAIYNVNGASPHVERCTFFNNWADLGGGGIYNDDSSPTIVSCLFYGHFSGAAIENRNWSMPTIINSTVANNTVFPGAAGMYSGEGSAPRVSNSIFHDNAIGNTGMNDANPTFTNCLIQGSGGSANWNRDYGTDGGNNIDVDPLFANAYGPDANPGTADDDLHLQAISPAIDAGSNDELPETSTTDLDGLDRITDGDGDLIDTVDMGAYESP